MSLTLTSLDALWYNTIMGRKRIIKPDEVDDRRSILMRGTPEILDWWDHAAKERGLTRNGLFAYVATAFGQGTILIADPVTLGKFKQEVMNQILRTVRVVARKETRLSLNEEGFTTTPFGG